MTQLTRLKVKINFAEVAELKTLSGIGPAISQNIVEYRITYGNHAFKGDHTEYSVYQGNIGDVGRHRFHPKPLVYYQSGPIKSRKRCRTIGNPYAI